MIGELFFTYWYFYIPQFLLSALMYTLLGRFLLSLFFSEGSDKVIWRVFHSVTQPFVKMARAVTPHIVPENLVVLFAFVWVLMARLALYIGFLTIGLKPSVGG